MRHQRESNPHFVTPPLTPPLSPPLSPPHPQPSSRRPKKATPRPGLPPANVTPQPHPPPIPYVPPIGPHHYQPPPEALLHPRSMHPSEEGQPQVQPGTLHHGEHVQPQQLQQQPGKYHSGHDIHHSDHVQQQQPHLHPAGNRPQQMQQHPGRHHAGQDGHLQHPRSSLRVTGSRRKTRPLAWLIAAICTLFWVLVIVGGIAVLIIYLVFHPRLPKFDISSVTLNAAYLDMGYLLNADIQILGNFTNPNKRVNIDFSYVVMDLYHERAFIATRFVEPFTALKRQSRFQDIHMMTSQVPLTSRHSQELSMQMENGRVMFEIKGYFRARSKLGGFLRYSYWLYSRCTITVTSPPAGVMIAKKCITKR